MPAKKHPQWCAAGGAGWLATGGLEIEVGIDHGVV